MSVKWMCLGLIWVSVLVGPCKRVMAAPPPGAPSFFTLVVSGAGARSGDYLFAWDDGTEDFQFAGPDISGNVSFTDGGGSLESNDNADGVEFTGTFSGGAFGAVNTTFQHGAFSGSSVSVPDPSSVGVAATAFFPLLVMRSWRRRRPAS